MSTPKKPREVVERWEDVPAFESEADEADFWRTHCLSDGLLQQFEPVPPRGDRVTPPATDRPRRR